MPGSAKSLPMAMFSHSALTDQRRSYVYLHVFDQHGVLLIEATSNVDGLEVVFDGRNEALYRVILG
jgi:hypothetical protein